METSCRLLILLRKMPWRWRNTDFDDDGLMNPDDNAPAIFNPDQIDTDGDGVGDVAELLGLTVSESATVGGDTLTGTVTLLVPAPAGGTFVRLHSSAPFIASAPAEVLIPEGSRSATFPITTSPSTNQITPVTILAEFFKQYMMVDFSVTPPAPLADLELSMTASPDPVGLGSVVTYTIDVFNNGPEAVAGVTLVDTLPTDAVLKQASGTVSQQVPGPGLRVRFDYTYDTSNFFDTQEKKDLLQWAGDILVGVMGDDLAAIEPDSGNTWTAIFPNPTTGLEQRVVDPVISANELVVYVGARDLSDSGTGFLEGAEAGPGGWDVSGSADFRTIVRTRGEHGELLGPVQPILVPGEAPLHSIRTRR